MPNECAHAKSSVTGYEVPVKNAADFVFAFLNCIVIAIQLFAMLVLIIQVHV